MNCVKCKAEIPGNSKFCLKCGSTVAGKLVEKDSSSNPKMVIELSRSNLFLAIAVIIVLILIPIMYCSIKLNSFEKNFHSETMKTKYVQIMNNQGTVGATIRADGIDMYNNQGQTLFHLSISDSRSFLELTSGSSIISLNVTPSRPGSTSDSRLQLSTSGKTVWLDVSKDETTKFTERKKELNNYSAKTVELF